MPILYLLHNLSIMLKKEITKMDYALMVNGVTFTEFMKRVDFYLNRVTGFDSMDLPDYCYIDCWRAGDNPIETAKEAIEYAKDY